MEISIAERLRPFSHTPGVRCLLPGTTLCLQCFPSKILFFDMAGPFPKLVREVPFSVEGPVKGFTVQQDLEKGEVHLWGEGQNGFFRYKEIPFEHAKPSFENLSLGNHKAQDGSLIHRRCSFTEIFPLWFRWGQLLPSLIPFSAAGTLALLKECETAIASHRPETILPAFEKVYLTAFEGMLVPRLQDTDFHGIAVPSLEPDVATTPLWHLVKGARLIRSLFITTEGRTLKLLSALPPEFHSGRMLRLHIPDVGMLAMEWTKKTLRRMQLQCTHAGRLTLHIPPDLQSYRLRTDPREKGVRLKTHDRLELQADTLYLFDNFQRG